MLSSIKSSSTLGARGLGLGFLGLQGSLLAEHPGGLEEGSERGLGEGQCLGDELLRLRLGELGDDQGLRPAILKGMFWGLSKLPCTCY